MKLITITGPHGAGKDAVIRELVSRFSKDGIDLQKALYIVTRKPRSDETPGVDILFAEKAEFMEMVKSGEIHYHEPVADYFAGYKTSEIKKAPITIANITLSGVIKNKEILDEKNDKVFAIHLNAPEEQRRGRLLKRNPELSQEELNFKIATDPSINLKEKDFDLSIENLNGTLDKAVEEIYTAIKKFISE